jgi:hypothetical protein
MAALHAARKQEALKEPARPHQPARRVPSHILAEDIEWKPFAAFPTEARLVVLVGHPLEQYLLRAELGINHSA